MVSKKAAKKIWKTKVPTRAVFFTWPNITQEDSLTMENMRKRYIRLSVVLYIYARGAVSPHIIF